MSKKISLKKVINTYLDVHNEIKSMEDKIKEKKKLKKKLDNYLVNTFKSNNIHNKEIGVSSTQSLYFIESDKKEAMSQKYIKNTLTKFFTVNYKHTLKKDRCEEKATEIYEYLLSNRDDKKSYNIKILQNN